MAGHPAKQSDLKPLVELSALIGSSLDIQTVLDNAMACAQAFMNAEASAVFELDMPRGELFFSTNDGQGGISPVFFQHRSDRARLASMSLSASMRTMNP